MTPHRRWGARKALQGAATGGVFTVLAIAIPPALGGMAEAVTRHTATVKAEVAAHEQVDTLDQRTQDLVAEQRQVERQLAQVRAYREQLTGLVATQQAQLEALQTERDQIERTEIALLPLLADMADTLARFVELDLPFLLAERRSRATALQTLLKDPEVTVGEKYRRIMAGYLEEAKYGTGLETYRDVLSLDDRERHVEVLRVGRIALIYRTPDGREYGVWDQTHRQWLSLPRDYTGRLATAFRVADKQIAPELLTLPLPAPGATR